MRVQSLSALLPAELAAAVNCPAHRWLKDLQKLSKLKERQTTAVRITVALASIPNSRIEAVQSPDRSLIYFCELVRQVSAWCSGAAAYFGWMREAKRENTRCGL
jgi:hypothetical protein